MTLYYLSYYTASRLIRHTGTFFFGLCSPKQDKFFRKFGFHPSTDTHVREKKREKQLSLTGAALSIIFVMTKVWIRQTHVMTKHIFCHDKSMLIMTKLLSWQNATNTCLSWQNYACIDKITFVATNICHTCVVTKTFCHDRHIFVVTKDMFCRDKNYTCAAPANDKKGVCGRGWRMKSWAADRVIFIPPPD